MTPLERSPAQEQRPPRNWRDDLPADAAASVVVFLVAVPLCMGIAIASGMPPAAGLLTGVIGGVLVGAITGAPLQVSGPAAGLVVIVAELVRVHGLAAFAAIVLLAGLMQVAAAAVGLASWFRAVPPGVIQGMLAGIGALIVSSQLHVLMDQRPAGSGIANLATLPDSLRGAVTGALALGVLAVVLIVAWDKLKPKKLLLVPGALVAVVAGGLIAMALTVEAARVVVPASWGEAITLLSLAATLEAVRRPEIWTAAAGLAFVASAETLLCASALDRVKPGHRTDHGRELFAQGIGNAVCGVLGALPMTGVIVRSAANVNAGGRTRASTILHGVWIFVFVAALPFVLAEIPIAVLAAVLVVTGAKLLHPKGLVELWQRDRAEAWLFIATFAGVVAFDLLTGVLLGLGLGIVRALAILARPVIRVEEHGSVVRIVLAGALTFLAVPAVGRVISQARGRARTVVVDTEGAVAMDRAITELIHDES
jgi:MFS superfamily sulfate permease-like transporter